MELTILGTSSMVPTKERNPLSVFLSYKADGILFDCAEGTQRQMDFAGISRTNVTKILISHWHGDHVIGLLGLFQTIGNAVPNQRIELYGPKGTKKHIKSLLESCVQDFKVDLKVKELSPKDVDKFLETEDYELYCTKLEHSVPCLGYSFAEKDRRNIDVSYLRKNKIKEGPHLEKLKDGKDIVFEGKKISSKEATYIVPGKKISYVIDTVPNQNAIKLAKNSDILICEATYLHKLQEKADKHRHMTAQEAGQIASQAGVKELIITHFSQRYKQADELVEEARAIFPNTKAAFDLMKIKL